MENQKRPQSKQLSSVDKCWPNCVGKFISCLSWITPTAIRHMKIHHFHRNAPIFRRFCFCKGDNWFPSLLHTGKSTVHLSRATELKDVIGRSLKSVMFACSRKEPHFSIHLYPFQILFLIIVTKPWTGNSQYPTYCSYIVRSGDQCTYGRQDHITLCYELQ